MLEEKKEYSLEEYLAKDENGITLLENLLKEGKELDYSEKKKLKNSFEACYLFVKYNQSLYFFELTEEQLFTNINGKPFIEIILESKSGSKDNFIKQIKNNQKIVDLLIKTNNKYYFSYLSDEIMKQLVKEDINNECYIEKYFNDEDTIERLIDNFNDPKKIIELCEKNNKLELLKYCNPNALMTNINGEETLLDYLLSKNILPDKLENIPSYNENFVRFIASKNLFHYFRNNSENLLIVEIENNKTLLEILIDKGMINELKFDILKPKTIEVLHKKNRLDLIKTIRSNLLLSDCKEFGISIDTNLVEYLLDNNYKFEFSVHFLSTEEDIKKLIEIFLNKKLFTSLADSLEIEHLFYKTSDGVPIIDKLLEENVKINFGYRGINKIEIIERIFNKKRYDLLLEVDLELLLNLVNDKETYLDYLLEEIKNKRIKYNLNNFDIYLNSINEKAKFYICIAKHDMIEYIRNLTEEDLLKENEEKTLLDELISIDKELTINKILSHEVKSSIKIATYLKSKGIIIEQVDIPLENKNLTNDYLNERHMQYGMGPLQKNGDYLLNKLQNLFISDGESDKELIEALISGYRQALIINYDIFIKEVENLIQIKENNKEFRYLKEDDSGYFSRNTGAIHCDNSNVNTLMHETGHALHFYMADNRFPENLEEVIERVRKNSETIKKIEKLVNNYSKIRESMFKLIEVKCDDYFKNYFTIEKNNEIIDFMLKSKEEKKQEFKDLGIEEQELDIILNEIFTSEEYIKTQKRLFIEQNLDDILREEYGNIMAVSDILDGIYEGELRSGVLRNNNNELINRTAGHGISYYSTKLDKVFSEMMANFSAISKSPNASEGLKLLKETIGDELYNLISDFYYSNIIYKQEEKAKTL